MRTRPALIAAGIVAALALLGGVAAWAHDRGQRDTIAEGVAVAGVELGGQDRAEAAATLRARLERPLRAPVVVTLGDRRIPLAPRRAGVEVDVEAMVDAALERGREGSFVARVARGLTGGEVDANVRPRIAYERAAVDRFVRRVAARLDRPARDAQVSFSGDSLGAVEAQDGVRVRTRRLRAAVVRALRRVGPAAREVPAPVRRTRASVTRAELAARYPVVITVDRANFQLHLWKELRRAKSYTVAIGAVGLDTPAGLYHIQNKAIDPVWSVPNSAWAGDLAGQAIPPGPSNPIKARWLGIFDGAGIHGTDQTWSLGSAASHGCVRMAIPDVIELYDQTPVGAPIYIA